MNEEYRYAACVIRKVIDGQPCEDYIPKLPQTWAAIGEAIVAAPPSPTQRTAAFEIAVKSLPDEHLIREAVYSADLNADLSIYRNNDHTPRKIEELEIPQLPDNVQLDPKMGVGAGSWVDEYIKYAQNVSPMTPVIFHESAALWLAAVAIARRLVLRMYFGDIYPNLFILWIAPTTLYRKSTALTIARNTAHDVFPHLLSPQDTTPEAFLSDLAGQQPTNYAAMSQLEQENWNKERTFAAQRGWVLDEMSGLMAGAGKDYNAGLLEALLRFYDCDSIFTRSTRNQGRIVVRNAYLNLLGATTPAAISLHIASERLWGLGWWPRFALLTPEYDRPEWKVALESPRPTGLVENLRQLHERLPSPTWPDPPETTNVSLGPDVMETWEKYNRALSYDLLTNNLNAQLWGPYGRLPTIALRVALILAALDWEEKVPACIIELSHLARAMQITESWRASVHRALSIATQTEFNRMSQRILYQIDKHEPTGATLRDIYRQMADKRPIEIEKVLYELIQANLVEEVEPEPGRRGKPVKRYRRSRD